MLRILCILALLIHPLAAAESAAIGALSGWLSVPPDKRGAPGGFAAAALSKEDAARAAKLLWDDHAAHIRATRSEEIARKVIRAAGKEMRFEIVEFGTKDDAPPGGRSLFISLHGGGNAPQGLNDDQWKNQIALARAYKPAEGLYIAPRAPTDTWNLWHEAHIDALFARLIESLIVLENVNPGRVYILGYSAGGDGVFQLAPRMADRLAAASMMAGHPNETRPDGLRNVPFSIQIGELDAAYDRNKVAAQWGEMLDALRKGDPGGYEHFTELHRSRPHWMDTQDRKAVPWMEKFTRNPTPDKIVWLQDDVTHDRFYWLAVPAASARAGQKITATRDGQTITLASADVAEATVLLNDSMLDLGKPVVVKSGGKILHDAIVPRTIGAMQRSLAARGDPHLVFCAEVNVTGIAP